MTLNSFCFSNFLSQLQKESVIILHELFKKILTFKLDKYKDKGHKNTRILRVSSRSHIFRFNRICSRAFVNS